MMEDEIEFDLDRTCRAVFVEGRGVPGFNLDHISIEAGLAELKDCGYNYSFDACTFEVIKYALARWQRGEERAAERMAIDETFHGVTYTVWRRCLAAARAHGEALAH